MSEWISVKDKLPESNRVIVCYLKDYVHEGYYCKKKKAFYNEWNPYASIYESRIEHVTHWQSLPEPPKE